MFVEDPYGVLVVLWLAQTLMPVVNDVLRLHRLSDVADDVLAELVGRLWCLGNGSGRC